MGGSLSCVGPRVLGKLNDILGIKCVAERRGKRRRKGGGIRDVKGYPSGFKAKPGSVFRNKFVLYMEKEGNQELKGGRAKRGKGP